MLVKLENVSKSYNDFVLNCSLSLREGRITGLVGQNGAGKSTTFKAILGLIRPEAGTARVLGKDFTWWEGPDREQIGTVLSDTGFGGHMTVKQVAAVSAKAWKSFREDDFLEMCKARGLPLDKKLKTFSTGMRAKLKVLTAVSHDARLLILDEPTAGLDVVARDEILDTLREYMETEGRGILISSHISSDLEGLCDDIYMIHEGKIVFHEDTDVILSDYGVLKATEEQYQRLDQDYLLWVKKESYGYRCLTRERRFYQENFPDVIAEACGIDEIQIMLTGGQRK